jgi:hypothetical protein
MLSLLLGFFLFAQPPRFWHQPPPPPIATAVIEIVPENVVAEKCRCPIPPTERVPNRTGSQCVWSSLETLGRWAKCSKLIEPPLTSRLECQSVAWPGTADWEMSYLEVRKEAVFGDRDKCFDLIRKAMKDRRACMFTVKIRDMGHAMVLVHFDEAGNEAMWIDNGDPYLRVQKSTCDYFKQRFDNWVVVIYADNDDFPSRFEKKKRPLRCLIPIRDRNAKQGAYADDYIPTPDRRPGVQRH